MHLVGRANGSRGGWVSSRAPLRVGALLCGLALSGCFNPDDPQATGAGTDGTGSTTMASGPTTPPSSTATTPTETDPNPSAGTTEAPTTSPTADSGTTEDPTTAETDASSTGDPSDCPSGAPTPADAPYLLTTVLTEHGSTDVDVADINGDGNVDFITVARSEGSVESFFGDGEGGFTSQGVVILDSDGFPDRVRLGAIADDTVDLFVHMESPVELWVMRGDGAGNWPSRQIYDFTYVRAIDLGDLNADDILDIAYVGAVNLDVRLGANTEDYGDPVGYGGNNGSVIRIADITGDGNVDILTAEYNSNELQILAGDGAGVFTAEPTLVTGSTITGADVGYFDGDALLDLALTTADDLRVFYGQAGGGVSTTPGTIVADALERVRVADIDADGVDDVVTRSAAFIEVRFSNGDQSFTDATAFECPQSVTGMEIVDVNDDCVPDIVAAAGQGQDVCLLLSDRD